MTCFRFAPLIGLFLAVHTMGIADAAAQVSDEARRAAEQARTTQERAAGERQEQRRRQLQTEPRVQMQGPTDLPARGLLSVDDQPCFFIARVEFEGLEDTPFDRAALGLALRGPDRSDPPEGQCLGAQ